MPGLGLIPPAAAADEVTPVMLGENFYGPRAMHEAIRARACDPVMPDLMRSAA